MIEREQQGSEKVEGKDDQGDDEVDEQRHVLYLEKCFFLSFLRLIDF